MATTFRLLLALLVWCAVSCTPGGSGGDGDSSGDGGENGDSGDDDADSSGEGGNGGPIALTDARLDSYLVFRRELNTSYVKWTKDAAGLAKSVEKSSTDVGKGLTAAMGATHLAQKYEKETNALRSKHGFGQEEDDRLWEAIGEVVAASPLANPAMAEGVKNFKAMQARGGDEKAMADEILQGMEEESRKGLAEARRKYGDACVDLLVKRAGELGQLQADFMKEYQTMLEESSK